MKKRTLIVGCAVLALLVSVGAQEKATLGTPQAATVTDYTVMSIYKQRLPDWAIMARYRDNTGKEFIDAHHGSDAEALVKALNKSANNVKTEECRVLEHLVTEGKIPTASCTGSPQ